MKRIIVFDFSGTMVHREIAEEAAKRRLKWLGKKVTTDYLRKALPKNKHYKLNKDLLSKYTGIKDDKILTVLSTDLFKIHMFAVANEKKKKIFRSGILDALKKLKKDRYQIAVMSGVRSDIIYGMMKITKTDNLIDYICAQNPTLDYPNEKLLECIKGVGKIEYVIGDKMSDIQAAKRVGAKAIFLKGGHRTGGEEKKADFVIDSTKHIIEVI